MKVFVTGATGEIGTRLVPKLIARGHDVVGTTQSREKVQMLRDLGAEGIVVDLLDRDRVRSAVAAAAPDAIIHEATALKGVTDWKHFDRSFAKTNRLRTEGTDALLAAARANGVSRFVAQSYAGWAYGREGDGLKTEDDPLDAAPIAAMRETHAAIRHLEQSVVAFGGTVLRYGGFYGEPESAFLDAIRKRQFPIVGDGGGVWSFIHLDDAAEATVLALEQAKRGIYNIVDDDPAPVRDWLPALADALGAKQPRRVPRWLAKAFAGEAGVFMSTEVRGASNAKAKRELGWTLKYPSWRQGFVASYGGASNGRGRRDELATAA